MKSLRETLPFEEVDLGITIYHHQPVLATQPGYVEHADVDLKSKFKVALRQMDRAKVWTDAEKASELKRLLEQIEQLMV